MFLGFLIVELDHPKLFGIRFFVLGPVNRIVWSFRTPFSGSWMLPVNKTIDIGLGAGHEPDALFAQ